MKSRNWIFIFFILSIANAAKDKTLEDFFKTKNCDSKCTFPKQNLTLQTSSSFPSTCSTVCADLVINDFCDMSEQQMTSVFQNMKTLVGGLTMVSTNFTSAKFLAGLESIECYDSDIMFVLNKQMLELGLSNLSSVTCPGIHVAGSLKMKKMVMPSIKTMTPTEAKNPVVDVFLSPDSNDFCVTTEEMKMFMVIETADVDHISAKYCEPTLTDKLCKKPAAGCVEIIGDVEIKSGFNTDLMKNVEAIYGSLIIKATTLTNFGFLEKLKYVATLEHKPAISIEDNKNLTNVDFPSLKRIRSDSTNTIEFKYNNRALSADPSICFGVRKALNLSDWAPTFDDFSCEILETQAKAEAAKKSSIVWNGLISVVSLVFIL